LAGFEADLLNVHVDFPLFQRLALPIASGRSKIPGIKIQDMRMMRLMEVLLHGGSQLAGWRTAQIYESIQAAFGLSAEAYTLTQLRYDLRKMKGHGLRERDGRQYCYRLTEKGKRQPPCLSFSTSGSAASWRTPFSTTDPRKPPTHRPKSKWRTTRRTRLYKSW
jgi:hypothetical protein